MEVLGSSGVVGGGAWVVADRRTVVVVVAFGSVAVELFVSASSAASGEAAGTHADAGVDVDVVDEPDVGPGQDGGDPSAGLGWDCVGADGPGWGPGGETSTAPSLGREADGRREGAPAATTTATSAKATTAEIQPGWAPTRVRSRAAAGDDSADDKPGRGRTGVAAASWWRRSPWCGSAKGWVGGSPRSSTA